MDKRYQVFVSSTFEDLQEERKEVMQALLELDCIPAGMELFPASNDDQWTLIKSVIDDSDYYILIIGGRYGSTNDKGVSYTQMEYEYALETGKPVIAFLHKNPNNIPSGKSEQDPEKKKKLEEFKELAKKKLVNYWDGADNLGLQVTKSIVNLKKRCPAVGWVKADKVIDETSIAEISRLQKENDELKKRLNIVATTPPEGSEEFARGEDTVMINYSLTAGFVIDGKYKDKRINNVSCFTWNQLFSAIAPSTIIEFNEKEVRDLYNTFLDNYFVTANGNKVYDYINGVGEVESERVFDIKIQQDSFDLIKIQFIALGLIDLVFDKNEVYWKLTPYGNYMTTKTIAIKKK